MSAGKGVTRKQFLIGGASALALAGGAGIAYRVLRSPPRQRPTYDYAGPALSFDEVRDLPPADVCIIGSGPAGATLATDLASHGRSVLVIDSGRNVGDLVSDTRYEALERFDNAGAIDYPVAASRVRALGGTSNIWTGRCARLHPLDFERNAYTPEGAAWPFRYAEFEPYYARAEKTLHVLGGELSSYHAPRTTTLPQFPGIQIDGLQTTLENIGLTADPSPTSKAPANPGPIRVGRDLLPTLTAMPGVNLLPGATVTRLVSEADGRVAGVEVRDLDNNVANVKASAFVVAGGALATSRLLLLSSSDRFPNGIGNDRDLVGRFFNEHPNLTFMGEVPAQNHEFLPRFELVRCHQFYDEFKDRGLGSVILVFHHGAPEPGADATKLQIGATVEMEPAAANRVTLTAARNDHFGNPVTSVDLNFSARDNATIAATRDLIRELYARLGATNVVDLGISWSHHHIGTCRMGTDPAMSVVNADLRVHDCENLYVLSSANFVTGGASHPTLAIVGLAHRLAEHLVRTFA